jgi:hypothetical protein
MPEVALIHQVPIDQPGSEVPVHEIRWPHRVGAGDRGEHLATPAEIPSISMARISRATWSRPMS